MKKVAKSCEKGVGFDEFWYGFDEFWVCFGVVLTIFGVKIGKMRTNRAVIYY